MPGVPAVEYHDRTRHTPASVRRDDFRLDFENKPLPYKVYEDLASRPLAGSIRPPQQPALAAIAEPTAAPLGGVATGQSRPAVDLDVVAQLCYYAAGVTKDFAADRTEVDPRTTSRDRFLHAVQHRYHAASCTGKLYHVDCYLVCGDLPDLPAGVYHFDPLTCSLDVLRKGDFRGTLTTASGGHDGVSDAPLTAVTTSTWWRNAWKYRARTFRHAFWDSGTLLANLLAVAHGLDLRAEVVTGFADGPVADLLGVDPASEAPLELVPVGRGDPAPAARSIPPIDPPTRELSPDPVDYPLIRDAWQAGTLDGDDAVQEWRARRRAARRRAERVDGRSERRSREPRARPPGRARTERTATAESREPRGRVGTRDPGDGDRIPLEPADRESAPATSLPRTVRRRGSCREYRRDPVPYRTVSTVLDRATRGVPLDVREDGAALAFTDCYLVANDVDGLSDGTYHYHPDAGDLERLRDGTFRREAGHLALDQRLGADAALNVYFCSDLDAVTDCLGDRGYRVAQLEAALTAGRLYLATYAHDDLGGTGLTFYDDVVTEFFSPRATGQTPMFLYTLGRPA